jgi:uncharacterized protein YdhG (YjbR/CyaY superfamily)
VANAPSVDAYLSRLPSDQQEALGRLRAHLASLLPDAEEAISYGIPAFRLRGRPVVWFAGWKAHCSIYPLTDTFIATHRDELAGFRRTKGSLHFTPTSPLPEGIVTALVRARLEEMAGP